VADTTKAWPTLLHVAYRLALDSDQGRERVQMVVEAVQAV